LTVGIIVLIILIFTSAFFSGVESAFFSLGQIDRIEIEKSTYKNRKILLKLLNNREKLLSTILIGNNVINIAASALNTALAIYYAPIFGISSKINVSLFAIMLTFVILLFGEITPKTIAISHNRSIALFTSPIIYILSIILSPVSYFFDKTSRFLSRLTPKRHHKHRISESTVINVVTRGEELGVINETEKNLIQNVFLFDEREVYPIMTPRTRVFALHESKTLNEVQEIVFEKLFSRIPIYSDSIDTITGIVNLKNIFKELLTGNKDLTLKEIASKPLFVYETLSLTSLLEKFKTEQNHLAIVVDEFGGMAGIVTLEDILEELVGEIYDEKDEAAALVRKAGDRKWLVSGLADIVAINRSILGKIMVTGDYESLQGLVMSYLERVPVVGDSLVVEPHRFTVIKMKGNEILSVLLEYIPQEEPIKDEQ